MQEILGEILANQVQNYIKRKTHHCYLGLLQERKVILTFKKQCNFLYFRVKERKHMVILTDAKKIFNKIYPMIKKKKTS